MEKEQFHVLINNYTSLTREEVFELISLQKDFPYCQIIHHLTARATQDSGYDNKQQFLAVSAIYATDRSVLKSIMTAPQEIREVSWHPPLEDDRQIITEDSTTYNELLYEEVETDINRLNEARRLFEETVNNLEKTGPIVLAELHKPADPDISDGLIEEIEITKKKIPEGPKQKEQIEIIDNFIKSRPTIGKPKADPQPHPEDLTEKNEDFGENIVSETLVEILLKQGRKEKAIEVLKKLIWKFPQKKAYFASRIEELKN